MAYYKTDAPEVLAAWKSYTDKADSVQLAGKAFADRFAGATPVFSTSVLSGYAFYGLKFSPVMDVRIWTKPNSKTGFAQFPRRAVAPGVKGEDRKRLAAELAKIREEFAEHSPKEKADFDSFLDTMGLGNGALFFAGYKQRIVGGFVYIQTSAKPSSVMTEILGSEFDAVSLAK